MEMEVHRGVQTSQPQNNLHYHHHHMQHYEAYIKTEPSEGSSSASENSGSPNKIHVSTSSPSHEGDINFSTSTSNTNSSINYTENSAKSGMNKNLGLARGNARCAANRALTADRKRPYPCLQCPSRFGSKMELEEHQNSHTGMKPFECDICKSRFNRRSTLWNHKRIHSEAKPFVCTVCQMQFKWKNSLKCHKEMHLRKNEATDSTDDIKQLTYATAAKRKMAEAIETTGNSSTSTASSITHGPLISSTGRKRAKISPPQSQNGAHVIVQNNSNRSNNNPRSSAGITTQTNLSITTTSAQNQGGHNHNHGQNQHSFHSTMGHNLHASDLLGHHQHPSNSNQIDLDSNFDFVNNLNANLMQAICSGDMEHQLGPFDFGRSQNHASSLLFSQADDQSKMLSSHFLGDIKTDDLFGRSQNHASSLLFSQADDQSKMLSSHFLGDIKTDDLHTNSLTAQMNSTAPSLNMRPFLLNSVIGMDLQHFNSLANDRHQHHFSSQQLNNSMGMDYVTDSMLNAQAQNSINASHLHIPPSVALNATHVTTDMLYQQPLDPALLLNTASHGASDYLSNIDYMVNHNVYGSHTALVHNDLSLPSAADNIPSPIPVHPQHHGYSIGQAVAVPTPISTNTSSVTNGNNNRSQLDFQQDLKNVIQKVLPSEQCSFVQST
uniref:C2H2-type domain-containing protein n=1 Tax=Acrobeloides nanus TaxID=290746 RepID=A0A914CB89_9BILA